MNTPPPLDNNTTPPEQTPPPMPYDSPNNPKNPHQEPHTNFNYHGPKCSSLAISSMVCSIVGFFTCFLTTLPGIVLGHISLYKIKRSNGNLSGKGQAIAGIAVGYSSFIFIIPLLAALASPLIIRQIAQSRAATASENVKGIYSSLKKFSIENEGSISNKNKDFQYSNDYLRELFASATLKDENLFFVSGITGAHSPDQNIQGNNALSKGENIFSYVIGTEINDPTPTPLLVAPLIRNGNTIEIDTTAFGGKVVILYTDGSARTYDCFSYDYLENPTTKNPIFSENKMWSTNKDGELVGYEIATPDF